MGAGQLQHLALGDHAARRGPGSPAPASSRSRPSARRRGRTGSRRPGRWTAPPQIRCAATLPRRSCEPSTTSSCSRVAVWMNSTAAASFRQDSSAAARQPRGGHGQQRPQALAAGRDEVVGQRRDDRHGALHARTAISASTRAMSAWASPTRRSTEPAGRRYRLGCVQDLAPTRSAPGRHRCGRQWVRDRSGSRRAQAVARRLGWTQQPFSAPTDRGPLAGRARDRCASRPRATAPGSTRRCWRRPATRRRASGAGGRLRRRRGDAGRRRRAARARASSGVERDAEALALARGNIALNGLDERVEIVAADVAGAPRPPGRRRSTRRSPIRRSSTTRRASRRRTGQARRLLADDGLAAWIGFLLKAVREGGTITLIHRADRAGATSLALLAPKAGSFQIRPVHPFADAPAKRVLVRAVKRRQGPAACSCRRWSCTTAAAQSTRRRPRRSCAARPPSWD